MALDDGVQDGGGAGGGGNTLGSADQLAVELRDDEADGLGSAGGVRDDIDSGSAGAAKVALSLRAVEDHLIAGIGVDGAHNAGLDGSEVVEGLGHRGEAVGGAGSGGDDVVAGLQGLVVDVVDDGGQIIAGRSGDDDLAGAGVDVSLSLGLAGVEAGAFEDDVHAQLAPGQLGRVRHLVDDDLLAVDNNVVVLAFTLVEIDRVTGGHIVALGGVVLEQVREHFGGGQIVDGNNFVTFGTEHLTERQTADTTKTIDCNFNRHKIAPPYITAGKPLASRRKKYLHTFHSARLYCIFVFLSSSIFAKMVLILRFFLLHFG